MNNKDIKKLALSSYIKNELDEKKALKIAKLLNRIELKEYIKAIKLLEKKLTVTVYSPKKIGSYTRKQLQEIFKNKKIIVKEDKSLIAGIRIEEYDDVYDLNLENTLKNIIEYINN
jgi:F0F1-type ATP synthase delta subunit